MRISASHGQLHIDDVAVGLAGLAYLASLQADPLRAGRLLGAAAAIVASMGKEWEHRTAYTHASYYRLVEMSRSEIDQAAWEEGTRMTIDQAIDFALQVET